MSSIIAQEELLKAAEGNAYKLVLLAAKRALEIAEGSNPLVKVAPTDNPGLVALKEIAAGKVKMASSKKRKK